MFTMPDLSFYLWEKNTSDQYSHAPLNEAII